MIDGPLSRPFIYIAGDLHLSKDLFFSGPLQPAAALFLRARNIVLLFVLLHVFLANHVRCCKRCRSPRIM